MVDRSQPPHSAAGGRRPAGRGGRRRRVAARRAARPTLGLPVTEGRLQPAGPVRLLHGAGRRPAPRRVRHAGPPGRRAVDHHRRRPRRADGRDRWADAFCATGREPVRLLHARASSAGSRALRAKGTPAADHAAVEQALLAHLCRCTGWRTILDAWDVARRDGARSPAATSTAATRPGRARGRRPAAGRARRSPSARAASPTTPRRRTRSSRCPTAQGGWAVGDTLAEARAVAGKVQGRRTTVDAAPSARPARRATGPPTLRTSLGRAGLPRARRVVVRARRRAAHAARQRRRLRRQARELVVSERRPLAGRRARPAGPGAARPRGRRAPRAQAPAGRRRRRRGRARACCGSSRTPGIAAAIAAGRARPRRRGGRRRRARRPRRDLRAAGWAEATVLLAGARGADRHR